MLPAASRTKLCTGRVSYLLMLLLSVNQLKHLSSQLLYLNLFRFHIKAKCLFHQGSTNSPTNL